MIDFRRGCWWSILLLLVGCSASPPTAFYALSTTSQPAADPLPLTIGLTLSEFPSELDRPQIMLRVSDNRLRIEEQHQWAGPLDRQVVRTLVENLTLRTGSPRLETFPWPADFRPDRRIEIEILRFDGRPGEQAELTNRWYLRDAQGQVLYTKAGNLTEPAGDSIETLVAAQSRLLARLAAEIAAVVRKGG